jgi:hypothetical protein
MAAIAAGVAQSQDLTQAITASDNAAAERLWSALGAGASAAEASTAQLRDAGDPRTQIQAQRLRAGYTAFGQTQWALTDQVRFVGGMACVAAGQPVLELMNQVVAGQRWGLGATGKLAQFKAGWGPVSRPARAMAGWIARWASWRFPEDASPSRWLRPHPVTKAVSRACLRSHGGSSPMSMLRSRHASHGADRRGKA